MNMNNGLKNVNRNFTADFLKGIMIFCVLYGHSISMINDLRGVSWTDSVVNVFITTFEMPLFILISGYFLYFSIRKKSYRKVLFQRIFSIAIPLLIWEGIPAFYSFVVEIKESGFDIIKLLKIGYRIAFPRLWFLQCYLICSIFIIVIEKVISEIKIKRMAVITGAFAYSSLIILLHFVNHSLNCVPFMFPFFLIGYYVSKYNLLSKDLFRKAIFLLALLFVILFPFYKPENSFYILGTFLLSEKITTLLPIFIHRFILGLSGCALFYLISAYLCKKMPDNKLVLSVITLGQKTMELYVLSTFIQHPLKELAGMLIKDFSRITDITAPLLFGPLFFAAMTTICLLVNKLIEKNVKLHKILFGR